MDVLLELWPAAGTMRKKRMLSKDAGKDRPIMNAPHMNILGASTESTLINGINLEYVSDGHSARTLVMPAEPYREKAVMTPEDLKLGEKIENKFKEMFKANEGDGMEGFNGNNGEARIRNPIRCVFSEGVPDHIFKISCREYPDPEGLDAMIRNRDAVNIKKLAMLRAIMVNPKSPVVTLEHVRWAGSIVKHSGDYQLYLFRGVVGESQSDKAEKSITAYLAAGKGKWVKQKQLLDLNALRQMDSPKRMPLLNYMVKDAQTLVRMRRMGRGKPSYVYKLRTDPNEPSDGEINGLLQPKRDTFTFSRH